MAVIQWNINFMPAVILFVGLDFEKNCYSRTASQALCRNCNIWFDLEANCGRKLED